MQIDPKIVKELRDRTNAGMMDCKRALTDANGDLAKAEVILRTKGIASASKKASIGRSKSGQSSTQEFGLRLLESRDASKICQATRFGLSAGSRSPESALSKGRGSSPRPSESPAVQQAK